MSAPSGSVASVAKALRVLEAVGSEPGGVTARQIADRLGLALPTTYHLLTTLVDGGYVVHLSSDHRYGLGYRVRLLDQALHRQLAVDEAVAAAVRVLHDEADAAAYYAVYRESDVVLAHIVDSERRPRVRVLDVGFHEAAHATAFGKVMLAGMDRDRLREYLHAAGMPRLTSATITDIESLEAHLAHVREANIALEIGEFQPGLSCMAAPVWSPARETLGSVAISLPSKDFASRRWTLERLVRSGANRVTRALRRGGCHQPPQV